MYYKVKKHSIKILVLFVYLLFGIITKNIQVYASVDFVTMDREGLEAMKEEIEETIEKYHKPKSKVQSAVEDRTKKVVEEYLEKSKYAEDISWPWFDYTYANDWGYYSLTTSVEYKDTKDKKYDLEVYAEAYPYGKEIQFAYDYTEEAKFYDIYYLKLGDEILRDNREDLPKQLSILLGFIEEDVIINEEITEEKADSEEGLENIDTSKNVDSKETSATEVTATSTPIPVPTATNTPTPEPTETSVPIPTPADIVRGAKGDEVKEIQERLIELGYLSGSADGIFGAQTEAAIRSFQEMNGLGITGIATAMVVEKMLSKQAVSAPEPTVSPTPVVNQIADSVSQIMVWIPNSGSKYHSRAGCSNMNNPTQVTLENAKSWGYTACKRCH